MNGDVDKGRKKIKNQNITIWGCVGKAGVTPSLPQPGRNLTTIDLIRSPENCAPTAITAWIGNNPRRRQTSGMSTFSNEFTDGCVIRLNPSSPDQPHPESDTKKDSPPTEGKTPPSFHPSPNAELQ